MFPQRWIGADHTFNWWDSAVIVIQRSCCSVGKDVVVVLLGNDTNLGTVGTLVIDVNVGSTMFLDCNKRVLKYKIINPADIHELRNSTNVNVRHIDYRFPIR